MRRYELLASLEPLLSDVLVIANIGVPSQELFSIGDADNIFYMLGSMGMCSSIGLGMALSTPKTVIALDGDGALLMNLGSMVTIANNAPENFILVVIDNGSYGSTGDQPTYTSRKTSIGEMAKGAGCPNVIECDGVKAKEVLADVLVEKKHAVIVVRVNPGNENKGVIPLHPIWIRDRFRNKVRGR